MRTIAIAGAMMVCALALACTKASESTDAKRMPKPPPPQATAAPALLIGAAVTVEVDGVPAPALDGAKLASVPPDFKNEEHRAWKMTTLLGAAAAREGAIVAATGDKDVTILLRKPASDKDPLPALIVSRRGEIFASLVAPDEPFPAYHGQGGRLARPGDPLPRVGGVTKIRVYVERDAGGAAPAFEPGDATDELERAVKASKASDKPAFLASAERAVKIQPGRPRGLYTLAAAYAVNGRADDAVATLARVARLKVYVDVMAEDDFATLRGLPAFARVKADLDALAAKRTRASTVAFRLPEKDFVAEGLARDEATGAFFVSSVHRRKIVRVAPGGAARDFTSEADGLMAVLGLALDAPRKLLWACTTGVPEMRGFKKDDDGRAILVALDLATGRVTKKVPLAGPGPHNCNDLLVDEGGTIFVSDAGAGDLLVLRPGKDTLETLVKKGFRSPQGIAALGGALYVADWSRGLSRVDRTTGHVRWLDAPDDLLLCGIDGLRVYDGKLIAVQNASDPHRVVELVVDGDRVRLSRVLEWNHPEFHEPTLGVVVGKKFFYVADSQWGSFDKDGKIYPLDKLFEPTVLELRLE